MCGRHLYFAPSSPVPLQSNVGVGKWEGGREGGGFRETGMEIYIHMFLNSKTPGVELGEQEVYNLCVEVQGV